MRNIRCRNESNETKRTQRIDGDTLIWWEIQHLALEREVVTWFCAAEDSFAFRADYFDAEVVELESVVGVGCVHRSIDGQW